MKEIINEELGLVKCHESIIVNINNISEINKKTRIVKMNNGEEISCSVRLIKNLINNKG